MGCCSLQSRVHLALLFVNSVWGIGAIVGAIGMSTTHPLAFLMVRKYLSGIVLLMGDWVTRESSNLPTKALDIESPTAKGSKPGGTFSFNLRTYGKTFALLGLTLFGSQFGFLIGIVFAGPVTGSVWQPSQPMIMSFICVVMGWERWNSKRMMGVAIAFCGCITMVLLSPHASSSEETADAATTSKSALFWIGNLLLFVNCICDPSYVLVSKGLLDAFSPLIVTAMSNFVSGTYMAIATALSIILVSNTTMSTTITDPSDPMWAWVHGSMIPPIEALPAMIWFVFFSSAGAYGLINWANQYATGTMVISYTVLQPVSAVILTFLLLSLNAVRDCTDTAAAAKAESGMCLTPPNMGTFFGMVGVVLGLSLIIQTEPKSDGQRKKSDTPTIAAGDQESKAAVPI